jgi:hypothetical protein
MRFLDKYTLQARAIPVAAVAFPPIVLLAFAAVLDTDYGIATGLLTAVVAVIAGQVGRDRGKALEDTLWQQWGGSPMLQRLRYAGNPKPAQIVTNLHARIERALGERLPTANEEARDPVTADARYEEAVARLGALTRDEPDRFKTLFAETVNYGQRRNMLGLRWFGAAFAGVTLVASLVLVITVDGDLANRAKHFAPGGAAAVAAIVFWVFVVKPSWVRVTAEVYADRLLEVPDLLDRRQGPQRD